MSASFVFRKIAHLKRIGLVSSNNSGFGENGGACPDWLVKEQKERREKNAKKSPRDWAAQFSTDD